MFDGNCLIGSTYVTLRYTKEWFDQLLDADYSMSELDKDTVIANLENKTFYKKGDWCYCEIQMKDFPANGSFKYDRNMAKVFVVAPGCEILSFQVNDTAASWEPVSGITIEDSCEAVECNIANRSVGVSTNESLAVFDRNTGGLKRIAPSETSAATRIPVFTVPPLVVPLGSETCWCKPTGRLTTEEDIVPVTYEEAIKLHQLAMERNDVDLLEMVSPSGDGCVPRETLKRYLNAIPQRSSLYHRVINRDVIWEYPKQITPLGKQKVYDFLVETTKVFVVNEGVVVYDTVNYVPILSDEANAECEEHIKSISNYLAPNGDLNINFDDLISMTMHNLTLDDVLKEKK